MNNSLNKLFQKRFETSNVEKTKQRFGVYESFIKERHLSNQQASVFRSILSGKNVLVTGPAGTGKSYLLNTIKDYLKDSLTIVSTTGISAINVGGLTLHSFLGLRANLKSLEETIDIALSISKKKIKALEYFAIEEVSMCDAFTFELMNHIFQVARNNEKPFGGVKVILFGDFLQLPPVSDVGYAFQSDAFVDGEFEIKVLKTSFRQTNMDFYKILQECRQGKLSNDGLKLLKTREVDEFPNNGAIRLFSTNKTVDAWNAAKFSEIPSATHVFYAEDWFSETKYSKCFDNSIIDYEIHLKVGARVILCKNISVKDGLINGACGVIEKFIGDKTVVVRFDNGLVENISKITWEVLNKGVLIATRNQIPLRLAYAITIHKSQGQTLDKACIDFNKIFAPGQAYVALSRLRSLDGLYCKGISKSKFFVDDVAQKFYEDNVIESD